MPISSSRKPALALAFALLAASTSTPATAQNRGDKAECASASEEAQRMQKVGKLLDAQKQLYLCTRSICPSVVRQDCEAWLPTLEAMIPSLVIAARDEDGRDLVDVKVTLDGAPVDAGSGRAVMVDPGKHMLHAESPGRQPADQPVVVQQGERARPVVVTLLAKDRPKPPNVTPPPPQVVVMRAPPGPPPTHPLVWIFGTLAGVSLASFVAFEIKASTEAAHLRSTCAPHCPQSDVDGVSTDAAIGNVSLVATGAFTAGAVLTWFLTQPSPTTSTTGLYVGPNQIGLRGRF